MIQLFTMLWLLAGVAGARVAHRTLYGEMVRNGLPWPMSGGPLLFWRCGLTAIILLGPVGLLSTLLTDLIFYR